MTSIAFYGETPFKTFGLAAADWCDTDPGVTEPADGIGGWKFRAYQFSASVPDTLQVVSSTAGQAAAGVLVNDPRSGQSAQLVILGETKVLFGATVSAPNTPLMLDANGCFIPWTSTHVCVGYSRYAQVAGDIGTAFVNFMTGQTTQL